MSARKHSRKQARIHAIKPSTSSVNYGELLRRAIHWIVDERIFAKLPKHGNTSWNFSRLIALAVLWVWSDQSKLTDAFADARNLSMNIFGEVALRSYQGMTEALVNWSGRLIPMLWQHLHQLMEEVAGPHWRVGKWLPLACDGSRFSTPRTIDNERAFGIKNYGKGKTTKSRTKWKNKKKRSKSLGETIKPQMWLTMIWHMGLKMPWCWRTGPSNASEREHLTTFLESQNFPVNTLFCCDAGFTGYELWNSIIRGGHQLLIRVGSNVHLLRKLATTRSYDDLVYLWPSEAARKKLPPLVLRLIKIQNGHGTMYLVTSVLNAGHLSDRTAMQLYKLRWGIELQFRSVKQTFGRRKLRSRTADNAVIELEWSLVGLWFIQLLAVKEQLKLDSPPERSSVAMALRVIQRAMRSWSSEARTQQELSKKLGHATKDDYYRTSSKEARYKPNFKDKPCRTGPKIKDATVTQRKTYQQLMTAA